jgi:hypothetical protein
MQAVTTMAEQEVLHHLIETLGCLRKLAAAIEVAQAQVAEQRQSQVEVAAAHRKGLETRTGILDLMTRPWQELMQFDGRHVLQKDERILKSTQFPELAQLQAVGARWTEGDDGVRTWPARSPSLEHGLWERLSWCGRHTS